MDHQEGQVSKAAEGLKLVSVFPPAIPMAITAIDKSLYEVLTVGKPFLLGQGYIIIAAGTTASGRLYFLTMNDVGDFVWIPEELCKAVTLLPQQPSPIMVPNKLIRMPA